MIKVLSLKKRILIITLIVLLAIFLVILPIAVIIIYNQTFGLRYYTDKNLIMTPDEFINLNMEEVSFTSNKGQKIAGYKFSKDGQQKKAVIILSHGIGSGFNNYMRVCDYFTSNDYLVFAFDNTGNDNSEGKSIKGLPQGVIDLSYAISYVENDSDYKDLPIMLMGHSWGGYSVTNVLNVHPEVKAVASIAGFNKSHDLIKSFGKDMIGNFIYVALPYVDILEMIRFGKYAFFTAEKGFNKTDAKILILHSDNDTTVKSIYGFDLWKKNHENDPRFSFLQLKGKGHSKMFCDSEYLKLFNKGYSKYLKEEELEKTEENLKAYCENNLDKEKYFKLDLDVMDSIKTFYDSCL